MKGYTQQRSTRWFGFFALSFASFVAVSSSIYAQIQNASALNVDGLKDFLGGENVFESDLLKGSETDIDDDGSLVVTLRGAGKAKIEQFILEKINEHSKNMPAEEKARILKEQLEKDGEADLGDLFERALREEQGSHQGLMERVIGNKKRDLSVDGSFGLLEDGETLHVPSKKWLKEHGMESFHDTYKQSSPDGRNFDPESEMNMPRQVNTKIKVKTSDFAPIDDNGRDLASPLSMSTINNYLAGTTYGANPGPCPTYDKRCKGLACNLQDYILDIVVTGSTTLREIVVEQANPCCETCTQKLIGLAEIWELQCKDIFIRTIRLKIPQTSPTSVTVDLEVDEVQLICSGRMNFAHLGVDLLKADSTGTRDSGGTCFVIAAARNPLKGDNISFTLKKDGNGIWLRARTQWTPKSGTFVDQLPYSVNFIPFVEGDDEGCVFDQFDFGIDLPGASITLETRALCLFGWGTFTLSFSDGSALSAIINVLIDVIVGILSAFIAGIICNIIRQFAYLNGDQNTPGGFNLAIRELWNNFDRYQKMGLRGRSHFEADEAAAISSKGIKSPPAVDYTTSNIFEGISLGLNRILGACSKTSGYYDPDPNKCIIVMNELVDVALGDKTGIFEMGDVKDSLGLDAYPSLSWTNNVFLDGKVSLKSFELTGLNSFRKLNILDNGYGENPVDFGNRYHYTFLNNIQLKNFGLTATFNILLDDGTWVTNRGNNPGVGQPPERSLELEFTMNLKLTEIVTKIAVLIAFLPDTFMQLQIGQLAGNIPSNFDRLRCFATSLKWLGLSGLQASLGTPGNNGVADFSLKSNTPNPTDIELLIKNGIIVFNSLYASALSVYLPYVSENYVRRVLNDQFIKTFTPQNQNCAGTTPVKLFTYDNPCTPTSCVYYSFENSNVYKLLSGVVNEIIGGHFITKSSGDVNAILNIYLDYYLPQLEPGLVVEKLSYGNYKLISIGGNEPININIPGRRLRFFDWKITNINSIHYMKLSHDDVSDQNLKLDIKIGDGHLYDPNTNPPIGVYEHRGPLSFGFDFEGYVNVKNEILLDDAFTFSFGFENLTISTSVDLFVNKNEILQLKFDDLKSIPCLLAVLDQKLMRELFLGFTGFTFNFNIHRSSTSAMGYAIIGMKTAGVSPTAKANIEYLFAGVAKRAKTAFNNLVIDYEIRDCSFQDSPINSNLLVKLGSALFAVTNFSRIYQDFTKYTVNPTDRTILGRRDGNVKLCENLPAGNFNCDENYFDIRTDPILNTVRKQLSNVQNFKSFMKFLADQNWKLMTADVDFDNIFGDKGPMVQLLITILDGLVYTTNPFPRVDLVIPMSDFGITAFHGDDYVPGLDFEPGFFRVNNLDQVEKFEILKPREGDTFTMSNQIYWVDQAGHYIEIAISMIIDTDASWNNVNIPRTLGNENDDIENIITFDMKIRNLQIDIRTITAINVTRALDIEVGHYIERSSLDCIGSIFYENGLYFDLFWIEFLVEDGPTFNAENVKNSGGPLLLNSEYVKFFSQIINILIAIIKDDIPKATHGNLRENFNNRASRWVGLSREIYDCGPTKFFSPPYFDFNSYTVRQALAAFNENIGGNPVGSSLLSINNLIEEGLSFALEKEYIKFDLKHSPPGSSLNEPGTWRIPTLIEYQNGAKVMMLRDATIKNLDSIHVLTIESFDPRTLMFDVKIGDGLLYNKSSHTYSPTGPLILSIDAQFLLSKGATSYADERFKFQLELSNLTIELDPSVDFNMNKFYNLNLLQVTKQRCIFAAIDNASLTKFIIDFADINIILDNANPFKAFSTTKFGNAFTQLKSEISGGIKPVPLNMLRTVLDGVTDLIADAVETYDNSLFPVEDCEVPRMIFSIVSGINTQEHVDKLLAKVKSVPGIIGHTARVNFDAKYEKYDSLYVQSDEINSNRAVFIQKIKTAAGLARVNDDPPVAVLLSERGPCAATPLKNSFLEQPCSWIVENRGNLTTLVSSWTEPQRNLIDIGIPASDIEGVVKLRTGDKYYDVQESVIVRSGYNFFKNNPTKMKEILRDLEPDSDFMHIVNSNDLLIELNLTDIIYFIDDNILTSKSACTTEDKKPAFLLQDIMKESSLIIPRLSIHPQQLKIKNIDDIKEMIFLKPYPNAKFTTMHTISYVGKKPISIEITLQLWVDTNFVNNGVPIGTSLTKEDIKINIELHGMFIQLLTLLAINTEDLGGLSLGDFMSVDKDLHRNWTNTYGTPPAGLPAGTQSFTRNCFAVTCLLTSIYDSGLHIPQLTLNFTNIIGPTFLTSKNLFSSGVEQLIDAVLEIVVQLSLDDIPNIVQGPLRGYIDEILARIISDAKAPGACPPRFNYTQDFPIAISRFDLSANQELDQMNHFIEEKLLNPTSDLYINNLVGNLVGDISTKLYEYKGIPIKYQGNSYGTFSVGFGKFTLRNLDEIDVLKIFDTRPYEYGGSEYGNGRRLESESSTSSELEIIDGRSLANRKWTTQEMKYLSRTQLGHGGQPNDEPLEIGFELKLEFDGLFKPTKENPSGVVKDHLRFTLVLTNTDIITDLFMLINIPRLMDLQVQSISSLGQIPCILAIFEKQGLIPAKFNMTFGEVRFKLACVETCTSPLFAPLNDQEFDTDTVGSLTKTFTSGFNQLIDFVVNYAASTDAQTSIDNRVANAQKDCEALQLGITLPPLPEVHHEGVAVYMGIAGLVGVFAAVCGFACLVPVHLRRRGENLKDALLQSGMDGQNAKSKDEFDLAERKLRSAFLHPIIPRRVKFLVPVMILLNIIFFITGNFFSNGAVVQLTLGIAGDISKPLVLLAFTLESSINDMWNAGVYPLAIIIALASGFWPYSKQIMLVFCWFAPATIMSVPKRQHMLELLDVLGKWSMIDAFVLIMLQVAFRFYITSTYIQQLSLLPQDLVIVDVVVAPGWGIFGFLFGAMGSLLVNHLMIWYNRKAMESDEELEDAIKGVLVKDIATPRIALWHHKFSITDVKGNSYRYSVSWRVGVVAMLALTTLLIIVGSAVPLMSFIFKGVAGLAIAFINQDLSITTRSLLTIGSSLIDGAGDGASVFAVVVLQILYFLFAFIFPLLSIAMVVVLFAVPLTLQEQILLNFWAEVVYCWESLVVFVFSVVAALLQISQLAQFIVQNATGSICTALEAPLRQLFPNDPLNAKCFDVVAIIEPTGYILIAGALLQVICFLVIWRLIEAALTDRERAMKRKVPISPGEMRGLYGFIVRRALEPFAAPMGNINGTISTQMPQAQMQVSSYGGPAMASQTAAPPGQSFLLPQQTSGYNMQPASIGKDKRYSVDV